MIPRKIAQSMKDFAPTSAGGSPHARRFVLGVVPFAFLGLALIHALLGRVPGGPAWIVAVYVLLLGSPALLGWRALLIFTLMLAGVGSADQLIDFRDLRGLRSGMRRK